MAPLLVEGHRCCLPKYTRLSPVERTKIAGARLRCVGGCVCGGRRSIAINERLTASTHDAGVLYLAFAGLLGVALNAAQDHPLLWNSRADASRRERFLSCITMSMQRLLPTTGGEGPPALPAFHFFFYEERSATREYHRERVE